MIYEIFYLIGASQEADLEKIKEIVDKVITSSGGVFEEKETLEKRRLSYNIKRETHGIYIAQRFNLEDKDAFKEINRKLNLENKILRFIVSRASELPELKSKEERISETEEKEKKKKESRLIGDLPKKQEKVEESQTTETKEEKIKPTKTKEDIDKKLEEILNI